MKETRITLTTTEQRRLLVLNQLSAGSLGDAAAARLLNLSPRQLRRLRAAYRQTGAAALAHGNRGRRPAHATHPAVSRRVVELATSTYQGFNWQHLTEMLAEREGIELSHSTLFRILTAAGVAPVRQRRPPKHRSRRDRYPREGMLLQLDASPHDWLEGRGPKLSLVGGVDDATSLIPWALFREQEDAQGYFQLLRQVVVTHGIPMAAYTDRHSIFWQTQDKDLTLEEQLQGRRQPTQFGRLLEELGVELILALSPQAKGRIERAWGTLQDRLTSELRLAAASTPGQAQEVLLDYLPRHNLKFAISALDADPAWIPWPPDRCLDDLFCFKYRRVVGRDNTVRFGRRVLQIPRNERGTSHAGARVLVHQGFDGSLAVFRDGVCLVRQLLADPPAVYRVAGHSRAAAAPPAAKPPKPPLPPTPQPRLPGQPANPKSPWRLASRNRFNNHRHASGQNH